MPVLPPLPLQLRASAGSNVVVKKGKSRKQSRKPPAIAAITEEGAGDGSHGDASDSYTTTAVMKKRDAAKPRTTFAALYNAPAGTGVSVRETRFAPGEPLLSVLAPAPRGMSNRGVSNGVSKRRSPRPTGRAGKGRKGRQDEQRGGHRDTEDDSESSSGGQPDLGSSWGVIKQKRLLKQESSKTQIYSHFQIPL